VLSFHGFEVNSKYCCFVLYKAIYLLIFYSDCFVDPGHDLPKISGQIQEKLRIKSELGNKSWEGHAFYKEI